MMQQGYQCPNCGQTLTFVPQYQNWYCASCGTYPFARPVPAPYNAPKKDESNLLVIIVIVVILAVILPIAVALLYVAPSGMLTEISTTPTGALDFTESTQTPGLYMGSFISLSKSVKLSDAQVTITDDSLGQSDSTNDLSTDKEASVTGGMTLNYLDNNANEKIDGGDTIRVSNADTGDIVKFVYSPTGGVIASYCFTG
jgi:hypothetical protein